MTAFADSQPPRLRRPGGFRGVTTTNSDNTLDSDQDAQLRRIAGCTWNGAPVEVVPGNDEPHDAGESFYFTTPGGKLIHHPNAYKWAKVYHPSTTRVEVGRKWLESRCWLRRMSLVA